MQNELVSMLNTCSIEDLVAMYAFVSTSCEVKRCSGSVDDLIAVDNSSRSCPFAYLVGEAGILFIYFRKAKNVDELK